jgi:hypothetical protein
MLFASDRGSQAATWMTHLNGLRLGTVEFVEDRHDYPDAASTLKITRSGN